jgi:ubiquinone/menaquinone biosynthesis C-methylase UbiE
MANRAELMSSLFGGMNRDFSALEQFLSTADANHPVIDVGSGWGRMIHLFSKFKKTYLVEKSEENFELLSKRAMRFPNCKPVIGNALCLPFESGTAGAICYEWAALAEMQPTYLALSEAARVLRPGGQIHISSYNPNYFLSNRPVHLEGPFKHLDDDWYYTLQVKKDPERGRDAFQTTLTLSNSQRQFISTFKQQYLSAEVIQEMFNQLGIEVTKIQTDLGHYDPNKSYTLYITGKKKIEAQPNITPESDFFSQIAAGYDDVIVNVGYQLPDWVRRYSEYIFAQPYLKCLDAACGSGWLGKLAKFYQPTAELHGLDFCKEMLDSSRKKNVYDVLAQADLKSGKIPIAENGFYDLFIGTGITEFVEDTDLFVSEASRLLRWGGKAIFTFEKTDPTGFLNSTRKLNMRSFSKEQVNKLLAAHHFEAWEMSELVAYNVPGTSNKVENYFVLAVKQNGQQR